MTAGGVLPRLSTFPALAHLAVTYLAARLKRDHPEIAAAVERGEYRSMRQAAIVAGIIKSLTPYQQILRLLPKLSPEERDQLAEMLREGA